MKRFESVTALAGCLPQLACARRAALELSVVPSSSAGSQPRARAACAGTRITCRQRSRFMCGPEKRHEGCSSASHPCAAIHALQLHIPKLHTSSPVSPVCRNPRPVPAAASSSSATPPSRTPSAASRRAPSSPRRRTSPSDTTRPRPALPLTARESHPPRAPRRVPRLLARRERPQRHARASLLGR